MTFELIKRCFNVSNVFCCSCPLCQSASFLVSLRNGSAIVARFLMNFEQKFNNPRNGLTSEGLVDGGGGGGGGRVSFTALTMSSEIFIPELESM